MVVVQHQHAAFGQTCEQLAEEPPGETANVVQVLGRQRWQRALLLTRVGCCGLTEIMKKSCQVGIAGIHLEPDALDAPGIEPARHDGGLAGTGRPDCEDCPTLRARLVQADEQPLARQRPRQTRTSQLGETRFSHWFPSATNPHRLYGFEAQASDY